MIQNKYENFNRVHMLVFIYTYVFIGNYDTFFFRYYDLYEYQQWKI